MTEEQARRLAQLRQAYENGTLDNDTYHAAVAGLGIPVGDQATVQGSGAGAQSGGTAAGAGGVAVGGDIHGNVYVGTPPRSDVEALRIYRRVLIAGCRRLPLRGLDLDASDTSAGQKHVDLVQVYVNLDTTARAPSLKTLKKGMLILPFGNLTDERRSLSALEVTAHSRHLVILGDPGSGKSTFLNHLGLILALQGFDPESNWIQRLPGWPKEEGELVPIFVILRDFATSHRQSEVRAEPRHLWDFMVSRLEAQNLSFAADPLHAALEQGKAVVLLDGLDEIPTKDQRLFVRDAVAAFAERYPTIRLIVTCRTLSYQDSQSQLQHVLDFELAPFDEEKIDRFIQAWYAEMEGIGSEADRLTKALKQAVRRPDLWRLASNPLLLTVMALVHTHRGRLPDARALLYEETADILLWRWEQRKTGKGQEGPRLQRLLQDANRAEIDLKRVLGRLAFEAHREAGGTDGESLADISENALLKGLASLHPEGSYDWARHVIDAMKLRAGLLVERAPDIYTFPHRTFQEYLAGAHLAAKTDFAQEAVRLLREGTLWREVILLAVGRLVYLIGETAKPLALVGELCPQKQGDTEEAWRRAWMAGDVLNEMGVHRVIDSALGQDLAERVRQRLADLLRYGALSSLERTKAGNALSDLGDPRFRSDAWGLPDEPLLGFVEVPAGPFKMGTCSEDIHSLLATLGGDEGSYETETPRHKVNLPAFYVARFPVTVAQFRVFVKASEYEPSDWGSLEGLANHPVANVCWYDAMAYCTWLTKTLRGWNRTPEPLATLLRKGNGDAFPWEITLPSEAEWEKAARGTDGCLFPWGDEYEPDRANDHLAGLGTTSAVGCFPRGASPYGIEDLSGNVWEWTRSLWGKDISTPAITYPYDPTDGRENINAGFEICRISRGGSFLLPPAFIRCAARVRFIPNFRNDLLGFRVVASPVNAAR